MTRTRRRQIFYASLFLFGTLIVCTLCWFLHGLFFPILTGAFLAYILRPLKNSFRAPWLNDELRIFILISFIIVGLLWSASAVRQLMPDTVQVAELKTRMRYKFNQKFSEVMGIDAETKKGNKFYEYFKADLQPILLQTNEFLKLSDEEKEWFIEEYKTTDDPQKREYYKYYLKNIYTRIDQPTERTVANTGVAKKHDDLIHGLSLWILTPLMLIFLLLDNGQIQHFFMRMVPNRYFEMALIVIDELDDAIGRYLRGTILECFLVGLSMAIGLFLLGVPLSVSVLIGFISGLINAVPFLGPMIGCVIGLAYALIAENIHPLIPGIGPQDLAVAVIGLVIVVHLLDNAVFQPFVLGNAVNLHPLVVIIGILGGSVMAGVLGMLLAIPTLVILRTCVQTLVKELKAYQII